MGGICLGYLDPFLWLDQRSFRFFSLKAYILVFGCMILN
jgi:hypothetical protein